MLGNHIRKRRLDHGLLQKQVAEQIGVSEATIWNWECHESSPQIHVLPQVIRFLGYNPLPAQESLAGRLLMTRKALGLTQKEMAKRLGIDPTTLAGWSGEESETVLQDAEEARTPDQIRTTLYLLACIRQDKYASWVESGGIQKWRKLSTPVGEPSH